LVEIEHDLQTLVENCALCNANNNNLSKVEQHVWESRPNA